MVAKQIERFSAPHCATKKRAEMRGGAAHALMEKCE
jgi:hypothetical protein